jgi:hypothetical protein
MAPPSAPEDQPPHRAEPAGASRHKYFCPYCGRPLEDEGEAFMRHIEESEKCQRMWTSWLELMRGGDAGGD